MTLLPRTNCTLTYDLSVFETLLAGSFLAGPMPASRQEATMVQTHFFTIKVEGKIYDRPDLLDPSISLKVGASRHATDSSFKFVLECDRACSSEA
jgi:hypothetical protein